MLQTKQIDLQPINRDGHIIASLAEEIFCWELMKQFWKGVKFKQTLIEMRQ